LADFDSSAHVSTTTLGFTTSIRGTSGYFAPEFLVGDRPGYDNKVDVWALGCILYELAAGKRAFSNEFHTLQYKASKVLPEITLDDSCSDEDKENIQSLLTRMLDLDANRRPSATDLMEQVSTNLQRTIAPRPSNIEIYQEFETSTIVTQSSERHHFALPNRPDSSPVALSDRYPGPKSVNPEEIARYNQEFIQAAGAGNLERARQLIDLGAEVNAKESGYSRTALHIAAISGELQVIKWLVDEGGADLDAKDTYGERALQAAGYFGHLDVIEWLVAERGADLQAKDNRGRTVLHAAAYLGHLDVVKWLVEEGHMDVDLVDSDSWTPLRHAKIGPGGNNSNGRALMKYLEERGAAQ
jgi:Protein kinase domain/Ankyrin repeats (3 copies)/Ankyrin repeat